MGTGPLVLRESAKIPLSAEVPLSEDCAISVVVRAIRCAAGVFAPGHLGELTQYLPFELVDCVLEDTRRTERRLRSLPSRVGVYFTLALCLFPAAGYLTVWGKLTAGLGGAGGRPPSEKALRDLRRRVGAAPLRALFETVAGPLAWPSAPGACYRGYRTVAFDGCSSLKAPDLERNRGRLGRVRSRTAWTAYPTVMLMALVETGTRALIGARFGPHDTDEKGYASRLLHLLGPGMLVLADRGFDGNAFLAALAATRAQFLVRVRADRRLPVLARLGDGSFLTRIGELAVRVIDADITVTCAGGTVIRGRYRIATTLLDPRRDPAWRLVQLYHERWEVESAFYALRHTILDGRVLRSGDPAGLEQELWALLLLYQLLRMAMADAAASRGADPDRASFTVATETARDQAVLAAGIAPAVGDGLAGAIGRAVLARLLPARRHRVSVRKVKSPVSRYAARPAGDDRPLASQNITALEIAVHAGQPAPQPGPQAALRPAGRLDRLLDLLARDPARQWKPREIAAALGISASADGRILRGQLSQWSRNGLIRRDGWGTYTAAPAATPDPGRAPEIPAGPPTRRARLTALLSTDPGRNWPRRHLAEALAIPPDTLKSFYSQLASLAAQGTIHRTARGHYSLTGTSPQPAT
jgi:hypothetical protein